MLGKHIQYNAQCLTLFIFPRDFRSLGFLPGAEIHPPPPMEREPEAASIYGEPADTYNRCGNRNGDYLSIATRYFFLLLQIAEAAAQFPLAFRQERLLQAKVRPPPQPGT